MGVVRDIVKSCNHGWKIELPVEAMFEFCKVTRSMLKWESVAGVVLGVDV